MQGVADNNFSSVQYRGYLISATLLRDSGVTIFDILESPGTVVASFASEQHAREYIDGMIRRQSR